MSDADTPVTPSTTAAPPAPTAPAASRAWRGNRLVGEDLGLSEVADVVSDPDTLVWIDLLTPRVEDLHAVVGTLGLPPTAIEDVLGRHERPKVVQHQDWVYLTTMAVSRQTVPPDDDAPGGHRLARSRVSAIATHSVLVTIRLAPEWDMSEVVRRWDADPTLPGRGVGALLHGLLDVIVDEHFDVIQELDDEAEHLEDVLLADRPTDDSFILSVYGLRKQLVVLRRVVVPMRDIVTGLERRTTAFTPEMAPFWGDLYDHVLRAGEWTESLRDMVAFLVETQMSLMDWRLNIVMKKLAGWAAIIAVPTAITGWFGQNVLFPGFGGIGGLAASSVLMVVSTIGLYVSFKRRDWL